MSTWRQSNEGYQELLCRFEEAVQDIWPEWESGECTLLSQKAEHLEELMLSSYALMKYIRDWLASQKLPFQQGFKFPNLYTALELAMAFMQRATGNLAVEASRLEQVSRAAYHWMKVGKQLGRQPTKTELDNSLFNTGTTKETRQPTWDEWQQQKYGKRRRVFCMCCKTKLATDDANMLCGYCSGMDAADKATILNMPDATLDVPKGKCYQCGMPPKPGNFLCDLCSVGQAREPGKATQIFIGNERHNVGSPIMRTPFDAIDRQFPLELTGYGDMMMPTRRK